MEAAKTLPAPPGIEAPDSVIMTTPSPDEKGVFYTTPVDFELPYELTIADWEEKSKYDKDVGKTTTALVSFTDGSQYVRRKIIPANQKWNTSVDFSYPLATRTRGFNAYVARKLAQAGLHTRAIGTNQAKGYSLLHDAQAALHILNEDDERPDGSCERGTSAGIGYSMGEMKQLLQLGLAAKMGREYVFSVGLDPCLAEKVDYAHELRNPGSAIGLGAYLGREGLELSRIFGKSLVRDRNPIRTIRRSGHFLRTVGVTPAYIGGVRDKWNVLATGETGSYLSEIPKDAAMVIHFFTNSYFNHHGIYKSNLSGHPNFRSIDERGWHLSGADPAVIGRAVSKVALGLELHEQGADSATIADALVTPILRD